MFSEGLLDLTIAVGALLLVFLPVIPSWPRVASITTAAIIIVAYGGARIVGGPAELWPAVAALLLGIGWTAINAHRRRRGNRSVPGGRIHSRPDEACRRSFV